jgi:hypothetical protein
MERFMQRFCALVLALFTFPKPVVAAMHGHALAGGCVIGLCADWRVLRRGAVVGSVDLGDKPEAPVFDGKGKMYVNLEDSSYVAVFDTKTLKVLSRWSLAPAQNPTGLAFDKAHKRLFSACNTSKTMVVLNSDTGKIVASVPIGGSDGAAFDPATQLAFSTNGEGTLTVIHEESPDKFTVVGDVPTQRGARTIALDELNHRIYTVTADFNDPPPATPENPRPRRTMVPGSFVILKLAQQ